MAAKRAGEIGPRGWQDRRLGRSAVTCNRELVRAVPGLPRSWGGVAKREHYRGRILRGNGLRVRLVISRAFPALCASPQ
jgi:hypothetical protein